MKVEELTEFFGLLAQNIEFDRFLAGNGILERPIYDVETENPFEMIEIPDRGLSFEFVKLREYRERYGSVRP